MDTAQRKLVTGAALIALAAQDDNLRDLSADDRAVALAMRHKAFEIILTVGVQPTELKDMGLQLIAEGLGRGRR